MNKPDVVICTNVYNRMQTLPEYLMSLKKNTKINYHVYLIANEDEFFSKDNFMEGWVNKIGKYPFSFQFPFNNITIIHTHNTGLRGYNIGLEFGKIYDVPVMLCNDDTIFGEGWDEHLLKLPTKVQREGKEVEIDPNSIGVVAPCYVAPGSMMHQLYDPKKTGYTNYDFCVGHAQLITRNALKKDFKFEPEWCTLYGPFDVYQSMWMCLHELNTLVCHDVCFDFPDSKESHFHNGDSSKFSSKLTPEWQKMTERLHKEYQPIHVKKWGYNKWYF